MSAVHAVHAVHGGPTTLRRDLTMATASVVSMAILGASTDVVPCAVAPECLERLFLRIKEDDAHRPVSVGQALPPESLPNSPNSPNSTSILQSTSYLSRTA